MKKSNLPLKIILAGAVAGLLVLAAFLGVKLAKGEELLDADTQVSSGEDGSPAPGTLGRMGTPKNEADVADNLAFAFSKSPDAVAWIQVPGTEINGLVMQGNDNLYYERRNEDGAYDVYGCYFADYECSLGTREDFSQNTIVYGHGNSTDDPNGKRFSQLFKFLDPDFAQKHPYLHLSTREGKFVFEIFAVFYTDTSFDYIQVHIDGEEKLEIAQKAQGLSLYDYGVELGEEDRLLTLSTCSMVDDPDGTRRFVVMGRLCPEGFQEAESVALTVRAAQ